jgi:hypothetical protein
MATKAAYQKKLAAQLREWEANLEILQAKAAQASADVRIGYENEIKRFQARQTAAQRTMTELGEKSGEAWEDLRQGAEHAWAEMGKSMERMTARFK